jgi:hypothetical protein
MVGLFELFPGNALPRVKRELVCLNERPHRKRRDRGPAPVQASPISEFAGGTSQAKPAPVVLRRQRVSFGERYQSCWEALDVVFGQRARRAAGRDSFQAAGAFKRQGQKLRLKGL